MAIVDVRKTSRPKSRCNCASGCPGRGSAPLSGFAVPVGRIFGAAFRWGEEKGCSAGTRRELGACAHRAEEREAPEEPRSRGAEEGRKGGRRRRAARGPCSSAPAASRPAARPALPPPRPRLPRLRERARARAPSVARWRAAPLALRGARGSGSTHGASSPLLGRGDSDLGAPAGTGGLSTCLGSPPCLPGACRVAEARRGLTGRGAAIPPGRLLARPPLPQGLSRAVIGLRWTHLPSEPGARAVRRQGWARMCAHPSPPYGPFPLCSYSRAPPLRLPRSGAPRLHPNKALAETPRGALLPVSPGSAFSGPLSRSSRRPAASSDGPRYYLTGSERLTPCRRTPQPKPKQTRIGSGCSSTHSTTGDPEDLVARMPRPSQLLFSPQI